MWVMRQGKSNSSLSTYHPRCKLCLLLQLPMSLCKVPLTDALKYAFPAFCSRNTQLAGICPNTTKPKETGTFSPSAETLKLHRLSLYSQLSGMPVCLMRP